MVQRRKPTLTPEEARQLHYEALVIDSQQPTVTRGFLFTDRMRSAVQEYAARGMDRFHARDLLSAMAAWEMQTSPEARRSYIDIWERSGVTVACGTYSEAGLPSEAFESAVRRIAEAQAFVSALEGELLLVRKAADIEEAHREGKLGIILDFQNATAIGDDLDRVDCFHNLGVRMIQLTYNLRNLVGDGCTEAHKSGLTYFGREVVQRLNQRGILVDVSHCSEQVGWDALEVSSAPIVISHASSAAICEHDRAKSDELAKAVARRGGYFGVVLIAGFIQESPVATLDDLARHVEHLVDVMGIDHVGIGTDKSGPGPSTESLIEFPESMPFLHDDSFNWIGFRPEHRLHGNYRFQGYDDFRDWPNISVHLAQRGFTDEELRKLLGLNFLRVFREVAG